jgi:adenylate kinase
MAALAPQLIILGPPGTGKSTQAARLAERLGVVIVNPGRILREEAAADSAAGQRIPALIAAGELAPDELVNQLVRERLEALSHEQGFVLDGYPRTRPEAMSLRATLARLGRLEPRPVLIWLDVPHDEVVRRLRRRREREGRSDDAEESIARRLKIHEADAENLFQALASKPPPAMCSAGPSSRRTHQDGMRSPVLSPASFAVMSSGPCITSARRIVTTRSR